MQDRRDRRRPRPAPAAVAPSKPPLRPANADNPFFKPYGTPFNVPPFDLIKNEHFLPAIEEGIRLEQAEVDAIVANRKKPTFENTIAALDHTGIFLSEVNAVFGALQGANTNDELQALARKTAPMLAAHRDNIGLNEKLFARVKAVYDKRDKLELGREELFLLENTYKDFVRGGALLDAAGKTRLRELNQELSLLSVKFGENVLAETNAFKLVIDNKADLAGLPPSVVAMAAAAAKQAGLADGKWLFTIQVPSMTPFLTYSERRPLREKIHRAYFMKGDNDNDRDNKEIAHKIAALRGEKAAPARLRQPRRLRPGEQHGQDARAGQRVPEPALGADARQGPGRGGRAPGPHRPRPKAGAGSSSPPGIGGITPRSCARKNTPSTTPPCGPTSSSTTSATASSPCAKSSTG